MATAQDRRRLDDAGVETATFEVIAIAADADWPEISRALDLAAELGARWINAHVHLPLDSAVEQTARLVSLATARGMAVGLEGNPFSTLTRAADVARLAAATGAEVIVDTLHFHRCGNDLKDLPLIAPYTRLAQISDGPAKRPQEEWWREAMGGRALPGEADLPLAAMLLALPELEMLSIEAPSRGLANAALETHLSAAITRTRALAGQAGRNTTQGTPS